MYKIQECMCDRKVLFEARIADPRTVEKVEFLKICQVESLMIKKFVALLLSPFFLISPVINIFFSPSSYLLIRIYVRCDIPNYHSTLGRLRFNILLRAIGRAYRREIYARILNIILSSPCHYVGRLVGSERGTRARPLRPARASPVSSCLR